MNTSIAKLIESLACAELVKNPYTRTARIKCADALRAWRKVGDRERARWLRYHISFIGYPLKTN